MDLIFTIIAIALLAILGVVLLLVAIGAGAGIAAGGLAERVANILIPGRKTGIGADGILGEVGSVVRPFVSRGPGAPVEGMVQVAGELWKAHVEGEANPLKGQPVRVVRVEGFVAVVEPLNR